MASMTFKDERLVTAVGFTKGTGCFTCISCGKKTRQTDDPDAASMKMCNRCWQMGGDDNAVSDGDMTEDEFFAAWGEHSTWYKPQEVA